VAPATVTGALVGGGMNAKRLLHVDLQLVTTDDESHWFLHLLAMPNSQVSTHVVSGTALHSLKHWDNETWRHELEEFLNTNEWHWLLHWWVGNKEQVSVHVRCSLSVGTWQLEGQSF